MTRLLVPLLSAKPGEEEEEKEQGTSTERMKAPRAFHLESSQNRSGKDPCQHEARSLLPFTTAECKNEEKKRRQWKAQAEKKTEIS